MPERETAYEICEFVRWRFPFWKSLCIIRTLRLEERRGRDVGNDSHTKTI